MFFTEELLGFPGITVNNYQIEQDKVTLKLGYFNDEGSCPFCKSETEEINQIRKSKVRDISILGKMTVLEIGRRQFYCNHCQKYFTEPLDFIDFPRQITERYKDYIFERVRVSTITQIAKEECLTYDQVKGIFEERFTAKKKTILSTKLSIDEFSHRKGHNRFATVICDLEEGRLLEVIDSHKQEDIIKSLMEWSLEQRQGVLEVSVDMWGGFTKVIQEVFPNARITYDRFHVMKIINEELNKIRKQCKNKTKKLKIKHIKYLLMKNKKDLNNDQLNELEAILCCSKRLKNAYLLKEEFRDIYETHQTPEEAEILLKEWMEKAAKFYSESIKTIKNHIQGICNYFYERVTSGMMEGINNKIKLLKRQAYGFTNFDHLRMRLLAAFFD
jgi:transposase